MSIFTVMIIAGVLLFVGNVFFANLFPTTSQYDFGTPDPRKWFFDERTGEFYRITQIMNDNTIVFDRESYDQRWQNWYGYYSVARMLLIPGGVFTLVSIILYARTGGIGGLSALLFLTAPPAIICDAVWFFLAAEAARLKRRIGPKPRVRPSPVVSNQAPISAAMTAEEDPL
jgi:hypothetical protein